MAFIIPADDAPYLVTRETNPELYGEYGLSMDYMRKIVDGYVEHVGFPAGLCFEIDGHDYCHLICDEDGKMLDKPVNAFGTMLYVNLGFDDELVGTVIFLEKDEIK